MRITEEQQNWIDKIHSYNTNISKLISKGEAGFTNSDLYGIREFISGLFRKHGYGFLADELTGDIHEMRSTLKDWLEIVSHVSSREIEQVDPIWKHHLKSKKIADMTGYEYETYLDLIGGGND